MAYLEYPKAVYLDGVVGNESRIVANAQEEVAARRAGFKALPPNPPPEPMQLGGPAHLPYPKAIYRGGVLGGDCIVVPNAEKEAEKASEGFYALGQAPQAVEDDAPAHDEPPVEDEQPRRRGRKPKAAPADE